MPTMRCGASGTLLVGALIQLHESQTAAVSVGLAAAIVLLAIAWLARRHEASCSRSR